MIITVKNIIVNVIDKELDILPEIFGMINVVWRIELFSA